MESIIEFILSNIFIVALLVGGLISALNRNKNQQNNPKRNQKKRREVDWETIFQQEEKDESPRHPSRSTDRPTKPIPPAEKDIVLPSDVEHSKEHEAYNEKIKEIRRQKEEAENKTPEIKDSNIFQEAIGQDTIQETSFEAPRSRFASISRKDAMNGIIWSEILGEPKSRRNSYYRSMRKQHMRS